MKIEEGKFYRTRDGRKVGPMVHRPHLSKMYQYEADGISWSPDGVHCGLIGCDLAIVAEWPRDSLEQVEAEMDAEIAAEKAGPVRTVTRKEIVPGQYGCVEVIEGPRSGAPDVAKVGLRNGSPASPHLWMTASELRRAAETLTEIADALGEAS